jgi:hypothetical protein
MHMSKLNNIKLNSAILNLGTLAILVATLMTPISVGAMSYNYSNSTVSPYSTYANSPYSSSSNGTNNNGTGTNEHPTPSITSLSPSASNLGVGTKTVTITGSGFMPNSVARVNNSSRPMTFVDPSHILIQINGNDLYAYRTNGGFFISIWNPAPGGGYSNAKFFTVNNTTATSTTTTRNTNNNNNIDNSANNNFSEMNQNGNENGNGESVSSLASNTIFGSSGFTPSGLIQWVLFAIIILIIVILVRKIFGGEKRYHATALKHH